MIPVYKSISRLLFYLFHESFYRAIFDMNGHISFINVFTVPLLMFTDTFPFCADTPAGNKTNATSKMVKFLKIRLFRSFLLNKNVNFVIFIVDNVLIYKILSTSIQPKDWAILWLFFFDFNYYVFSISSFLLN